MPHRNQLIAIVLCASIVLAAGCTGAGWGTDGPASPENGDETDDTEAQAQDETTEAGTEDTSSSSTTDESTGDEETEATANSEADSGSESHSDAESGSDSSSTSESESDSESDSESNADSSSTSQTGSESETESETSSESNAAAEGGSSSTNVNVNIDNRDSTTVNSESAAGSSSNADSTSESRSTANSNSESESNSALESETKSDSESSSESRDHSSDGDGESAGDDDQVDGEDEDREVYTLTVTAGEPEPVENVEVTIKRHSDGATTTKTTGSDGTTTFDVYGGTYTVTGIDERREEQAKRVNVPDQQSVTLDQLERPVGEKEYARIDVVDQDGNPVEGMVIEATTGLPGGKEHQLESDRMNIPQIAVQGYTGETYRVHSVSDAEGNTYDVEGIVVDGQLYEAKLPFDPSAEMRIQINLPPSYPTADTEDDSDSESANRVTMAS